jgi:hypothetical protein
MQANGPGPSPAISTMRKPESGPATAAKAQKESGYFFEKK